VKIACDELTAIYSPVLKICIHTYVHMYMYIHIHESMSEEYM